MSLHGSRRTSAIQPTRFRTALIFTFSFQGTESYDASGEYTTESEVDNSLTSEERNIHSSMDMSTSTCTVTPTHNAKVK